MVVRGAVPGVHSEIKPIQPLDAGGSRVASGMPLPGGMGAPMLTVPPEVLMRRQLEEQERLRHMLELSRRRFASTAPAVQEMPVSGAETLARFSTFQRSYGR